MPVPLTLAEMETHLNMTADNRGEWIITSDDEVTQRRFEAIGAKLIRTIGQMKEYSLPANQISLRNPSKPMTEERKAAQVENLRAARVARQETDARMANRASYDDEGDSDE